MYYTLIITNKGVFLLAKKMRSYRIEESTLEQIQAIRQFYLERGFDLSDASVIQKAVSAYMDLAVHDINPDDPEGR